MVVSVHNSKLQAIHPAALLFANKKYGLNCVAPVTVQFTKAPRYDEWSHEADDAVSIAFAPSPTLTLLYAILPPAMALGCANQSVIVLTFVVLDAEPKPKGPYAL